VAYSSNDPRMLANSARVAVASYASRLALLGLFSAWTFAVGAHHSHLEFSSEPLTLDGELVSLAWHNPHPTMVLTVVDGNGVAQNWHVQVVGNINGLRRTDVTGQSFAVGERLSITGHSSTRRPGLLLGTHARFADGRVAVLSPDESTGQAIYRASAAASAEPRAAEPDGIYRVWVVAERFRNPDLPLTPRARAAKEAWDPVTDDPQIGCRALGMPGAMMSPHPIEFSQQGSDIVLKLEEWDATRTIHMSTRPDSRNAPAAPMGYSVGRWEGRTLVVATSRIDYPFMDEHGTPQSKAVEIVERFTLGDDERSLDWEAVVTDPDTLTEPVLAFTTRWEWVPGEALQPYDCTVLELPPASGAGNEGTLRQP
jgi:hypothetical protein